MTRSTSPVSDTQAPCHLPARAPIPSACVRRCCASTGDSRHKGPIARSAPRPWSSTVRRILSCGVRFFGWACAAWGGRFDEDHVAVRGAADCLHLGRARLRRLRDPQGAANLPAIASLPTEDAGRVLTGVCTHHTDEALACKKRFIEQRHEPNPVRVTNDRALTRRGRTVAPPFPYRPVAAVGWSVLFGAHSRPLRD